MPRGVGHSGRLELAKHTKYHTNSFSLPACIIVALAAARNYEMFFPDTPAHPPLGILSHGDESDDETIY